MNNGKWTLKLKQKYIFDALSSFDINKLKSILQKIELEDSLTINELMDEDGHNLLHRAAYDNTFRISEFLITYYKQRLAQHLKSQAMQQYGKASIDQLNSDVINGIKQQVRRNVANWINTSSNSEQGFYPLHFASFHGNI